MTPTRLPLFPLPLVLFPGATLPLHIFEPRYRALIADCRADDGRWDGRFGIVLATPGPERAMPAGRVGCIAVLRDVRLLPDGRSNVVVEGERRFALARFVDDPAPYHVAEVHAWDDAPDGADLDAVAVRALDAEVRALFARVAQAARRIADDATPPPALPDDPAALAFAVAAAIDFDNALRQRLLAERSPRARLEEVAPLLRHAVDAIETRAAVHERARSNGHGPH